MEGVHNENEVHPTLLKVHHPPCEYFSYGDIVGLDNSILIPMLWRLPCQSDASRAGGDPLYICWCARGYCMHIKKEIINCKSIAVSPDISITLC